MTNQPLDLVGSSDAAKILGVHPATVTRLVDSGDLTPAGRLGGDSGAFVFHRADVEKLAEKRKAPASPISPSGADARSVF